MRVIVTGGRDHADRDLIWENLDGRLRLCGPTERLTVVHGHCPTGADHHADEWCLSFRATEHSSRCHDVDEEGPAQCYCRPVLERHPADWPNCGRLCPDDGGKHRRTRQGATYCPLAGHARNQDMADAGADVCLAFPTKRSRGTFDMIKRAATAGITVHRFDGEWP